MKINNSILIIAAVAVFMSSCCNNQPQGPTVIKLDNVQYMYVGIDNPITVASTGIAHDKLTVSICDGEAQLTPCEEPGQYIVCPSGESKTTSIAVTTGTDTLAVYSYKVIDIPTPELLIGMYRNGSNVQRADFTGDVFVSAMKPAVFDYMVPEGSIKVESLDILVGTKRFQISGNKLTPEVLSAIQKATNGDRINIFAKVLLPGGHHCEVPSMLTIER